MNRYYAFVAVIIALFATALITFGVYILAGIGLAMIVLGGILFGVALILVMEP